MTNISWAKAILRVLYESGVQEFVLCPGGRNAPFVKCLATLEHGVVHSFFEERSAGFFALGRAAQSGRPVAILTTSGTAVANLLPAVVEAHYSGVPIVVVSADRPISYRGSGAPQTIVQPGIFGPHAMMLGDWEKGYFASLALSIRGPSHLNVCFDEPLIDEQMEAWSLSRYSVPRLEAESTGQGLSQPMPPTRPVDAAAGCPFPNGKWARTEIHKPLIIVGGLTEKMRPTVGPWLSRQRCPVYLEACSGLRGDPSLKAIELTGGEASLKATEFDGLIRLGGIPTTRLWRDLESSRVPVLSFSELAFSGLARSSALYSFSQLNEFSFYSPDLERQMDHDRELAQTQIRLLREFPCSEMGWIHRLSQIIQPEDGVYLGNSLPLREWDGGARRDVCFSHCYANRGVNGIDGQLSTFFGWAKENRRNWALVGDLTALYDLSAPWAERRRHLSDFHLVIVNNGGGRIFQLMFREPLFENSHDLEFSNWAKMWQLSHAVWNGLETPMAQVIEIRPDAQQTEELRQRW